MPIHRDTVIWGFRLILGREPESEAGIQAHLALPDETALVEALLRSQEFRNSGRFAKLLQLREEAAEPRPLHGPHDSRSSQRFVVFGNCQAAGIAQLIQAKTGGASARSFETTPAFIQRLRSGEFDLAAVLASADVVWVQMVGELNQRIQQQHPEHAAKLRQLPPVNYAGFHPDCVYVARTSGGYLQGPMGEYQSSIAFWAWRQGLSPAQTLALFCDEVYEALGFHDYHVAARRVLVANGRQCGLPLASLVDRWQAQGCFMHTVNHPRLSALSDVVDLALAREGITPLEVDVSPWVEDRLSQWPVWPVYPGLARQLGQSGSLHFKLDRGFCPDTQPVLTLSLAQFIDASFQAFEQTGREQLHCERVLSPAYEGLSRFVTQAPSRWQQLKALVGGRRATTAAPEALPAEGTASSPYQGLSDHQFWRRAVERVAPEAIDPVTATRFQLTRTDRVATAGSCFAQHIARTLQRQGFNYLVSDADPTLSPEVAQQRGFGMYSARYGNIYTARQLLQLFDRAHGDFHPLDQAWLRDDGRQVDPFRPQIEPRAFARPVDVEFARKRHLLDVRRMFSELDVFVFTLGLTEGWRRRADGAVFPLAPGVAGGRFDPALYEFVNFSTDEVLNDLRQFMLRLRGVNPRARMIVTVSPVPLIATYENRHVLVSTVHSKSVLRAAAGALANSDERVEYFPSYEIITGMPSRGAYFEADLRSVTEAGVAHVMRTFLRHYARDLDDAQPAAAPAPVPAAAAPGALQAMEAEQRQLDGIICDEEAIERHLHR